ncbi:MAG TPA: gamma-glutamylcyclotransferase family protein [Gemmatimonadaceae bacterium]|nr:gamma-glutamylcyclotransferase family protein [Gemmatimonadaceae bacterium]
MSELVFAFGSNMCSGRFRDYGVSPEGAGKLALLSGYGLRFTKPSVDGSGKAHVEPEEGAEVWGVLYSIPDADLPTLDVGEGRGYARHRRSVRTAQEDVEAWVYEAVHPSRDPALRPYSWYTRFLVEGAKEHNLPADYVRALEGVEAAEDLNAHRDTQKRLLVCGERTD